MAGQAAPVGGASHDAVVVDNPDVNSTLSDALSALTNLGYARSQAHVAVMTVMGQLNQSDDQAAKISTEALIKVALKELAENG